jgi:hypothetical protein
MSDDFFWRNKPNLHGGTIEKLAIRLTRSRPLRAVFARGGAGLGFRWSAAALFHLNLAICGRFGHAFSFFIAVDEILGTGRLVSDAFDFPAEGGWFVSRVPGLTWWGTIVKNNRPLRQHEFEFFDPIYVR